MISFYMHSKNILKTRHYDSTRHLNRKGVFPFTLQSLLRTRVISDGKCAGEYRVKKGWKNGLWKG
jgi:hypothetical protein